mmetsp:Transcript_49029/g.76490  ORF Transcript_49029/g.76490 Transcript_49029/m.76490 type:complete len:215 (+) Transcript_49029:913-1557(+)
MLALKLAQSSAPDELGKPAVPRMRSNTTPSTSMSAIPAAFFFAQSSSPTTMVRNASTSSKPCCFITSFTTTPPHSNLPSVKEPSAANPKPATLIFPDTFPNFSVIEARNSNDWPSNNPHVPIAVTVKVALLGSALATRMRIFALISFKIFWASRALKEDATAADAANDIFSTKVAAPRLFVRPFSFFTSAARPALASNNSKPSTLSNEVVKVAK